jgi:uncharacterized membrane protein YraQ (UPF0718 family)
MKVWYQQLPWPLLVQLAGILLAIGAALLTYARLPGGVPAFVLAAGLIVAGLIALLIQYTREKDRGVETENEAPELRVYRRAPCPVDRTLLAKLARATGALRQRAEEKNWEPDWDDFEKHHEAAQQRMLAGDLEFAFLEYCRAIRPLTEALTRVRSKEDLFEQVWEKDPNEA